MISARIWRFLADPPTDHPLYRRSLRRAKGEGCVEVWRYILLLLAANFLLLLAMLNILVAVLMAVLLGLALILISASFQGAVWAAGSIPLLRNDLHDPLLRVTPDGIATLAWLIFAAQLRPRMSFNAAQFEVRLFRYVTAALAVLGIVAGLTFGNWLLLPVLMVVALSVGAQIYAMQSLVLAGLVAIASSVYTNSQLEARVWALMGFLTVQSITLVGTVAGLVPILSPTITSSLHIGHILYIVALLALILALREAAMVAAYRHVLRALNIRDEDWIRQR